jgi:1,4-alpha-glucan branching enzyme
VPRRGYRLGVPVPGTYAELLNSDADVYGGGNVGNQGAVDAVDQPSHGHAYSLSLTVPPLGFVLLKPNK